MLGGRWRQLMKCVMRLNSEGPMWETEQTANLRGEGAGGVYTPSQRVHARGLLGVCLPQYFCLIMGIIKMPSGAEMQPLAGAPPGAQGI